MYLQLRLEKLQQNTKCIGPKTYKYLPGSIKYYLNQLKNVKPVRTPYDGLGVPFFAGRKFKKCEDVFVLSKNIDFN